MAADIDQSGAPEVNFRAIFDLPYVPNAHGDQKLDIYIPEYSSASNKSAQQASENQIWIIYLHGGAWRDPEQEKTELEPTLRHFTEPGREEFLPHIAGFASINYTLSLYPGGPQPPDPDKDYRRTHPQHIQDVINGIAYVQKYAREHQLSQRYVLVGHSCGATLSFQVVMNHDLWADGTNTIPDITGPEAIIGLAGLYDLMALVNTTGLQYVHMTDVYHELISSPFGIDKSVWKSVSPALADFGSTWAGGRLAILGHSKEDNSVPFEQRDLLCKTLETTWVRKSSDTQNNFHSRVLKLYELSGDHDDVWWDGTEIAELIIRALNILRA